MRTVPVQTMRRGLDTTFRKAALWLPPCAGIMGSGGMLVSAAAAHLGGTSLATTGGLFLLLHAATIFALAALAEWTGRWRYTVSGVLLVVGSVLFSGDLALAGFYGWHPFPPAAPIGGLLLIAGWLAVPLLALGSVMRRGGEAR